MEGQLGLTGGVDINHLLGLDVALLMVDAGLNDAIPDGLGKERKSQESSSSKCENILSDPFPPHTCTLTHTLWQLPGFTVRLALLHSTTGPVSHPYPLKYGRRVATSVPELAPPWQQ